jgi:hypothetical protein
MLSLLLSGAGLKLGAALAAVLGTLFTLWRVRGAGVQAQRNVDLTMNLKRVENANAALNSVARLSDRAVSDQLHSEFGRD